jgi:putative transposase
VAVGKRLAAARGAWICFQDEAGQVLRPPVSKTWARRAHTPVVEVSGKGSGRVSIAGLMCLQPGRRGRLMWRTRLHRGRKNERGSFSEDDYITFLDQAHQRLRAPIVLIWDNLNTHVSRRMHTLIAARSWLTVIRLPPYAPDLNPTEGVWR